MAECASTAPRVETGSVAVIGVGCTLMRDDGAGPEVVRRLAEEGLPRNVHLFDAGTALMDVLPDAAACERIILVDACAVGREPGAIYRLRLDADEWPAGPVGDSLHHLDVLQALVLHQVAGGRLADVVLIGIEPREVTLRDGLSDVVEAKLPELIRAVRNEILEPPNARRGDRG